MLLGLLGMFLFGVCLVAVDYRDAHRSIEEGLERNEYGKGAKTEEIRAQYGKKSHEFEVEVGEQELTGPEAQEMFDRCIARLEQDILGENKSLDQVETNLDLVTSIPGEAVDISWELDRYDLMDMYGTLHTEEIPKEGALINLKAVLTYNLNPSRQALFECTAHLCRPILTEGEQEEADLEEAVRQEEETTRTRKMVPLPQTLHGQTVKYYGQMDSRGQVIIVMALVIGLLLIALQKQNADQAVAKRREQMRLDYPEIVNKLMLFMGAGMTAKRAWKKTVSDYERQKETWGARYAYEEMKLACHEMDSGIMESETYERFGQRCGLQEYAKLGALLSQNLKRGAKGLNQILTSEAEQAFEERKARAKRLGEEAGTKLLLPMFLMLAVVMIIVIVPAFMSMQL